MYLNLLDYIIIALILLSALIGLRRGFVDIIGGIASVVLGVLAAVVYHDDLARYLEKKYALTDVIAGVICNHVPLTAISLNPEYLKTGNTEAVFTDLAHYFASLLSLAGCFFFLLLLVCVFTRVISYWLGKIFNWGALKGINRVLGMVLEAAKNLVIMVVFAGVLYPAVKTAAQIELQGAGTVLRYFNESMFFAGFLNLFYLFETIIGINV